MEVFPGGQNSNVLYIKTHYWFICKDSGEMIDGTYHGAGEDKGDKAIYKAITGALKYILTTSFLIPTGDDPENETKSSVKKAPPKKVAKKAPLSEAQLNRMVEEIKKGNADTVRERIVKYHVTETQMTKLKEAADNGKK